MLHGADHVVLHRLHGVQHLTQGLSCDGHHVPVELGLHVFQHRWNAAAGVHGDDGVFAGGLEVTYEGHLPADAVEVVQCQLHAGLVSDGQQVEHQIGGGAGGHGPRHAVEQSLPREDLPGGDAPAQQLHDLPAGLLGDALAAVGHRRSGAAAGQRHAQYLCEHTHGVGGTQVGAASHGGQGGLLGLLHLFHGTAPLLHPAGEFPQLTGAKQRVAAHVAGQHGAAGDHDGRDVQPGGGHEHAGYDLVAAGDEHHGVKVVGLHHHFDGVGDEIPAGQRVAHTAVALAQAVADGDGAGLAGDAAPLQDAVFHLLGQFPHVHVAGNHLAEGVDHRHKGLFHVLLVHAGGVE